MSEPRKVWLQATTGKLHLRKDCGVTRRTRYGHFEVEFTEKRRQHSPRCAKCWDGFQGSSTGSAEDEWHDVIG